MERTDELNNDADKSQWDITYSYKYDLASFCNLFTKDKNLIDLHEDGFLEFQDVLDSKPKFIQLAQEMQKSGFDPRIVLVSAFDMMDYEGYNLDKLCSILEEPRGLERLHDYYVLEEELVTEDVWQTKVESLLPDLAQMVRYVHKEGFLEYWKENCMPVLKKRAIELESQTSKYKIVSEINDLLGPDHKLPLEYVTLYLSRFSAPFGTKLRNQSFLTDSRWDLEDVVLIALHEMIHPPFSRDKIDDIARFLWEDDLIQEAYDSQPQGSTYNTPLRFLEENLTEAAHVYLGEKLEVVDSPLEYFTRHDDGSHVVSVIIYDYLKNKGDRKFDSFEDVIDEMLDQKILYPGELRKKYCEIYDKSGISSAFQ